LRRFRHPFDGPGVPLFCPELITKQRQCGANQIFDYGVFGAHPNGFFDSLFGAFWLSNLNEVAGQLRPACGMGRVDHGHRTESMDGKFVFLGLVGDEPD